MFVFDDVSAQLIADGGATVSDFYNNGREEMPGNAGLDVFILSHGVLKGGNAINLMRSSIPWLFLKVGLS